MGAHPRLPVPTLGGKQAWADLRVRAGWRLQKNVLTGHYRVLDARNRRRAWGTLEECEPVLLTAEPPLTSISDHLVVLIHGTFRAKESFRPMERALRESGFEPLSLNYPSTLASIPTHTRRLNQLLDQLEGYDRVSFVGHSLGGILARCLVGSDSPWKSKMKVQRLVTLGAPNQGAEIVDRLRDSPLVRAVAGPAALALATDRIGEIPLPECAFGVVAGAKGDGKGWNPLLPGDDDRTVSLQSALLDGAEDSLVVPVIHTWLMRDPRVVAGVVNYLTTGRFEAAAAQ